MSTRDVGLAAEARAAAILEHQGYQLIDRNVRTQRGEIDAVAWEGETLCFVEVRFTHDLDQGGPLATIRETKQRRIVRAAEDYLLVLGREVAVRFDVLGLWNENGEERHQLVRGAFVAGR